MFYSLGKDVCKNNLIIKILLQLLKIKIDIYFVFVYEATEK